MAKSDVEKFDEHLMAHEELISEKPVENGALFTSLDTLEKLGDTMLKADVNQLYKYASGLMKAYTQIETLQVEPPVTAEQAAFNSLKLGNYRTLAEASAPKPKGRRKNTKPTDPEKIETDKPKK